MPRRQRLRRGVGPAAPLPRGAAHLVWEGSGNVICLDVLRALGREPESLEAFFAEVDRGSRRSDAASTLVDALRGLSCPTSTASRCAPGGSSSGWPWCCRGPCWSAMPIRRSPTRFAPRAWPAITAWPSARCLAASISSASSNGPARRRAERPFARHAAVRTESCHRSPGEAARAREAGAALDFQRRPAAEPAHRPPFVPPPAWSTM